MFTFLLYATAGKKSRYKIIIFLTLLLIALIIGRVVAGYFARAVPFLGALTAPLTAICVIAGVLLGIFIAIEIYNNVKGKK